MTPLDQAHAAMDGGTDAAALQFYHTLADTLLFVLLEQEAAGEKVEPKVFDLPDGPVLLAFDTEERLADFGQEVLDYAALPGRVVAQQLAGQGIALGLNFGSGAPSETLLPPEAMAWLAGMLSGAPGTVAARAERFGGTQGVPRALMEGLATTLAAAEGMATGAVLAEVRYAGGARGHVLAILDAHPDAEEPLARAVRETLVFSGVEAGAIDVTFLASSDAAVARMREVGQVFEVPALPDPAAPAAALPPGMDPDRPPRLR